MVPSSDSPSPIHRAVLVVVIWAVGLGAAMQFAKVALALEAFGALYHRDGSALGFLVTLVSLLGAGLGLFAGILAERIGLRRLLLGSAAVGVACALVQATLPGFGIMLATRAIEGLSHLGIVVAAPALIGGLAPPAWRNAAMTLWSTFFSIGFALIAWVGLPILAVYGLSGLILAQGAFLACAACAAALLLPRGLRVPEPSAPLTAAAILRLHREAYRSAHISAPAWGWLTFILAYVALLSILPGLVLVSQAGFVAGALPIVSILSSLTLGVILLQYRPAVSVIKLGFIAAGALAAIMAIWGIDAWGAIGLFVFFGLVQGASFAAIPQLNRAADDQALSSGAIAQMGNIGNLLGTPLLLAVLGWGGTGALMVAVLTLCLAGIGTHVLTAALRARQTAVYSPRGRIG